MSAAKPLPLSKASIPMPRQDKLSPRTDFESANTAGSWTAVAELAPWDAERAHRTAEDRAVIPRGERRHRFGKQLGEQTAESLPCESGVALRFPPPLVNEHLLFRLDGAHPAGAGRSTCPYAAKTCYVWKALRRRSADLQSAVSPNCIRQVVENFQALAVGNDLRITNPRYGRMQFCATPVAALPRLAPLRLKFRFQNFHVLALV
jgi:hypothetical protein